MKRIYEFLIIPSFIKNFNGKGFLDTIKYMYKDYVDMFVHILLLISFVVTYFLDLDIVMATIGIIGTYSISTTFRYAKFKKLSQELLEK